MIEIIVGVVIGLIIGGVAAWLIRSAGAKHQLSEQASAHREEAAGLKGQLEQVANAQDVIETAKAQLGETFKAAAADALSGNSGQFLKLANENFDKTVALAKGEFHRRHEQFQSLVQPLAENYGKLNPQIDALITQVQAANAETGKLSSALTDNRRVGSWGEIQLRRVVEVAGMTDYCDFSEQTTAGNSADRPDLIVTLPERRAVVVDAKASTAAYIAAQQANDDETTNAAWDKHSAALKRQVNDLAGKNYGQKVDGALDFVVMFVPGEQFLSAALDTDRDLLEYAMSKRVAIATPASLIAMLWAVSNGWQQFRLAEDAQKIKEVGEEMNKRMLTFIKHYQDVGRELNQTVTAFNRSINSFDSRVAPQGRRFSELVTGNDDSFLVPEEIELTPRISRYASTLAAGDVEREAA